MSQSGTKVLSDAEAKTLARAWSLRVQRLGSTSELDEALAQSLAHVAGKPAGSIVVDRPGLRIATGQGSAYDLFLERSLRHARLVRHPVARGAFDALARGECEAAAGVRQVAERYAREHGAMRVLAPSFMAIEQAMAVPGNGLAPQIREAVARYLTEFLREMLDSGCIAQALRRSGQHDVTLVPND